MVRCEAQRPHVADRASRDVHPLELERVECPSQDLRDELSVVLPPKVDRRAQPPAGPLEDDRAKAGEFGDQRRPPARPDRAVDEEHGLARSDLQDEEARCRGVEINEPFAWLEPVVLPQAALDFQVALGPCARGGWDRSARHDRLPPVPLRPLRYGGQRSEARSVRRCGQSGVLPTRGRARSTEARKRARDRTGDSVRRGSRAGRQRASPHRRADRGALPGDRSGDGISVRARAADDRDRNAPCQQAGGRPTDSIRDLLRLPALPRRLHDRRPRRRGGLGHG
jgi:hypothetical protein